MLIQEEVAFWFFSVINLHREYSFIHVLFASISMSCPRFFLGALVGWHNWTFIQFFFIGSEASKHILGGFGGMLPRNI